MRKLEFAVLALILSPTWGLAAFAATFPDPDEFGYLAREIGFDLRDVSVSGTALSLDDDDVTFVPLPDGFEFNFYGATYEGIAVSSNGFIAFSTRLNDGCCEGKPLPNLNFAQIPFTNIVAGFWEDLNSLPGQIRVQVLGAFPTRQFVVGYYGVEHFQGGEVTFEIILHEGSNEIELQYGTAVSDGDDAETSVGIEHPGGLIGLQIAFGPDVSFKNQGFLITPPASAPPVPGSQWIVDISPDVIKVRATSRQRKQSRERFKRRRHHGHETLVAVFIEAPEGASAADIDPDTVTLSLNGTELAEAEPISSIEGGLLRVLFRLDEQDMSAMLGVEIDRIDIDRDDNEIEVRTLDRPENAGGLIRLTVSGELVDGGRFSGGDALRVRSRNHRLAWRPSSRDD